MSTMTPNHPRWEEFYERLEGPEGCNFHEKIPGDKKSVTWKCKAGRDKSLAQAILEKMDAIDVPASLSFFETRGGYCDCEILFNVEATHQ